MAGVDVILGINLISTQTHKTANNASMSRSHRRDKRMRENANARTNANAEFYGFRFDNFTGTVTIWTPIMLSWHRDANDTTQINFMMTPTVPSQFTGVPPISTTDTTQPDGTLNVTFPIPGSFVIEATGVNLSIIASSQTFEAAFGGSEGSWGSWSVPSASVNPSGSETGQPQSSSTESATGAAPVSTNRSATESATSTAPILTNHSSTESTQSTATPPPILGVPDHPRRRYIPLHPQTETSEPEVEASSIPKSEVRNKIGEIITPMLRGVMAPDLEDRSQETVEEADPTEEGPQQEAVLDVVAEFLRMRTQLQQIIVEREAERGHGNVLDSPPAYA
ncbi:hypothetical protein EDD85DRAFT_797226 [Armillaria nabsnona]|nr:hypothetical protein EDD85DRAFT_797226 [Armillaria nabsnona]